MPDYLFRLTEGDGVTQHAWTLADDIEACVKSFNLLRDHPALDVVAVTCGERNVLTRTRTGGKSALVWSLRRGRLAGGRA